MYHYGLTIKEHREAKRWTQSHLAEVWPKSNGDIGVSTDYVSLVETGKRQIEDITVLRQLCDILDIPLWKVGLSEYNPFNPKATPGHGKYMYDETLDMVEDLIRQIWSLRCAARLIDAEMGIKRLNDLFSYFHKNLPPPLRLENRFQLLYLQVQRLNAVQALEKGNYKTAIDTFIAMLEAAKTMDNATVNALALTELGKELERQGAKDAAVSLLEDARDNALRGSKLLVAFTYSYLIRVYAGNKDTLRFERAVNTGLTMAHSLNDNYKDGTDFIYSWSPLSSILAEKSWGYIELGEPKKTLAMKEEIMQAIRYGQDIRLNAWIPLDWAKAYKMLGEIENCIQEAKEFYQRVSVMQSTHALKQVKKLLTSLETEGYGDVKAVKDFKEDLQEMVIHK